MLFYGTLSKAAFIFFYASRIFKTLHREEFPNDLRKMMLNSILPTIDKLLVFDASDRRTTYPTAETAVTFSTIDDHTRVDTFDGTKIITSYKDIEITFEGPVQMTPTGPLPMALFDIPVPRTYYTPPSRGPALSIFPHDSSVKITVRVHGLLDRVIKGVLIHMIPKAEHQTILKAYPTATIYPKHAQLVGVETLANGRQVCIAYHLYGTNSIDVTRSTSRFVFRCAVPLCPFGRMDICDHETITYEKREALGAFDKRILGQLAVCHAFQRHHLSKGYIRSVTPLRSIANVLSITYPDEPPILFVANSSYAVDGSIYSLDASQPNFGIKTVHPQVSVDNLLMRISVASPRVWIQHNPKVGFCDFGHSVSEMLLRSLRDCKFIIELPRDSMVLDSPFAKLVKNAVVQSLCTNLMELCKCTCLTTLNLSPRMRLNITLQMVDFPHLTNLSAEGGIKIAPELAQRLEVIALPLESFLESCIQELDAVVTLRVTERTEQELTLWNITQPVIYGDPTRITSGALGSASEFGPNPYNPLHRGNLDLVTKMPDSILYQWMGRLRAPQLKQFGVHELFEDAKLLMCPLVRNCEILTIAHLSIFDAILLTDYLKRSIVHCNLWLETLPEGWRLDELLVINLYTHPSVISIQAVSIKNIVAEAKTRNLSVERFIYAEGWRSTDLPWSLDEATNAVTNIPSPFGGGALVFAHKTFAARWPDHKAQLSFPLASSVVDLTITSNAHTLNDVAFIANAIYTLTVRAELLIISTSVPTFSRVTTLTIFVDDNMSLFNNPSYVTNHFPEVLRISLVVELAAWKRLRSFDDVATKLRIFVMNLRVSARQANLTVEITVAGPSHGNSLVL